MFGSGRANLSLRESWRNDLRTTRSIVDVQYIRFHAIFHDENAVYDEDKEGKPIYNFNYVDQIYDGLLQNGVRPYVELGFMPNKLAAKQDIFPFWYKPNVSPPKDWQKWNDLIRKFSEHLIQRYGIDEVSKWYFEVWNEPNIGFWGGEPHQPTYFKLYDETAKTIKSVNERLRVGGPSTAQAAWIDKFIAHCDENQTPVDFVSTHVYANDLSTDVFGTTEKIPRSDMVARAMKKVYDQVKASKKPNLPIIWSEFNASYFNEQNVTDSPFMGPWLANHIRQCDGLADEVSYWTFSAVFEEQGPAKNLFYGGFGLIATDNIPKAAFNAFRLMHLLGERRLPVESNNALVTKRSNGTIVVAVWNYAAPGETSPTKTMSIKLNGVVPPATLSISKLDSEHGSALSAWEHMGRPIYPTKEQQIQLRAAAEIAPRVKKMWTAKDDPISLSLKSQELAIVEIKSNNQSEPIPATE